MSELRTPEEVAEQLRCSRSKVYVMLRRRRLESIRVEGKHLIPQAAIDAYLAAHTVPAQSEPPTLVLPIARRQRKVAEMRMQQFGR